MTLDLDRAANPCLNRQPRLSLRDPALIYEAGLLYCFHTAVAQQPGGYRLFVDLSTTTDLVNWSEPRRLTASALNYSSPGNVLRTGDGWVLCVQSYPIPPGQAYGSEKSRLWLMHSPDLSVWGPPRPMHPPGCQAAWTDSRRQIDPYLVQHERRTYCFYKTSGCLGLLVSEDLLHWQEASPDRPVLGPHDTPDSSTVENPCIVRTDEGFALFFAPCRPGRGIGIAYSDRLDRWRDVHDIAFPPLPWAPGGPTAAMVLDMRPQLGVWLMAFHGDTQGPHGAALGLAWSDDLEHWTVP
jgi:hypothetical protein